MISYVEKQFFVVCLVPALSLGLVDSTQAQQGTSASFYDGLGSIMLYWTHSLAVSNALAYSEVNVNAENHADGAAIASAVADTSAVSDDVGFVSTIVATKSTNFAAKGVADSDGSAQIFFQLKNTSDQNVEVEFNWSADWLMESEIRNPETDRVEGELQLVLEKKQVRGNNASALAERIAHNIQEHHIPNSIYHELASSDLLPELSFTEFDSVNGDFTIVFGPGMTYLFVLSAEIRGFAAVNFGGCPPSYWRRLMEWPIDRWAMFSGVFGAVPQDARLNHAIWFRSSAEADLMSNAVAALLNATSTDISYFTDDPDDVIDIVRTAFDSGEYELASNQLAYYNNLGFPQICE